MGSLAMSLKKHRTNRDPPTGAAHPNITRGDLSDFDNSHDQFTRKLAEVKQRQPLRIVSVIVRADGAQAQAFSDRIICLDDLLRDRKQLRSAVAEIV